MKVHFKIKRFLGKITLLYILTFLTCFGKWLLGQKYMYRAFYSINIPSSNTPPHMDHLLCFEGCTYELNSRVFHLWLGTYDPNLPLKDIFFLLLSIALRKLTTNNKNLEYFSIETNVILMPKLIISCQSPWCIQVSSAFFTKKGKQLLNWPKCRKTIVSNFV